MCLFTQPVESVAKTRIFSRIEDDVQFLVYEMMFSSKEDLAMVLPVPVAAGAADDAVQFTSMEDCSEFFNMLDEMFSPLIGAMEADDLMALEEPVSAPVLEVHQVGCFEASFVPQRKDFERLDPRFRLPDRVWDQFADYDDYGFVVFKLKRGENQAVHPMAFSFPTRFPDKLFFPTVHIHDGQYHEQAEFGHELYSQRPAEIEGWEKSDLTVRQGNEGLVADGWLQDYYSDGSGRWNPVVESNVVHLDQYFFRRTVRGMHRNADIWAPLNP